MDSGKTVPANCRMVKRMLGGQVKRMLGGQVKRMLEGQVKRMLGGQLPSLQWILL